MKAAQINRYGGPEVIEIATDVTKPKVEEQQVLIEIFATSINPFDYKVRLGYVKDTMPLKFPTTLGGDFAGKVVEVGAKVTNIQIGDEIYGQAGIFSGGSGAHAEFAIATTKTIAYKPKTINFIEAAALPLVGSSAVQALEDHIKLQNGQKLLIHGGAGGIGTIAIQLAKALGGYVATTVSSTDIEYAKQLGADEVIDYKNQKFEEILKDFDAVYDLVGGETTTRSFNVLKPGGILVSMIGQPDQELAKKYQVTAIGQFTQTNTDHLQRLADFVDTGKIKIHVDKIFSFDQTRAAYEYQETDHPKGKVVIQIK